ncbi:MAG TPA: carboxypeptidase-like regulatory domain-containing protein [Planctomycetaceae bacterium]|nr:carboxypeptidase-like regulatory domain-containing protein [Planctomycetaceae bacterium]
MKQISLFKRAVIALAAIGMMLPAPQVQAATAAPAKVIRTDATVLDIGLKSDGVFAGRVVDHTGTPSAKTEVTIRQGQQVVAKATTDAEGRFAVKGLKGGVYEVASGATVGTYRVWNETMAPPAAKEQVLLVLGQNGARGQCCGVGGGEILIAGLVLATLVVSIITLDKVEDDDSSDSATP